MGNRTGGEGLARARRPGARLRAALIASVCAAVLAFWQKSQEPAPVARKTPSAQRAPEASEPRSPQLPRKRFVDGVRILDQRGAVVFTGRVELEDTLQRILDGERAAHRNDGAVFQNRPLPGKREPELPERSPGYYHEYVHPTPGVSGPGPQRIVRGREGEWYYTPDHYQSFIRLD